MGFLGFIHKDSQPQGQMFWVGFGTGSDMSSEGAKHCPSSKDIPYLSSSNVVQGTSGSCEASDAVLVVHSWTTSCFHLTFYLNRPGSHYF